VGVVVWGVWGVVGVGVWGCGGVGEWGSGGVGVWGGFPLRSNIPRSATLDTYNFKLSNFAL
jgi:hypothetical protein